MENRYILYNVLTTSEILHHMKCQSKGKKQEISLKIDISKAYDRVNWSFIQSMMRKTGFDKKWVKWMGICMAIVKYQLLVNSDGIGLHDPDKGL